MARDLAARVHVAAGAGFVALWALVVADLALHSTPLRRFAELVLLALVVLAMLRASRHIRILATVLAAGTALAAWRAGDLGVVERGLRAALPIGAFLPVVALVRATVHASPTVPAIRERVGAMTDGERRVWMTAGAQLLGSILTLGYVSVMRPLLPERLSPEERTRLAESGIRGLGLACAWSPFFVASAVAAQLVPGVSAWKIVALGGALSLVGWAIAHRMFDPGVDVATFARALRRLGPIVAPTCALVGAVVATSAATGWNVLQSVVVIVPLACFGWFALRARRAAAAALRGVPAAAGRMSDEVLIFTASTVFGATLAGAALPDALTDRIAAIAAYPSIVIAVVVLVVLGLGIAGLHPMVSASVIVPTCVALHLPIAEVVLAQTVVLSWALSSTVAAWTLPVVVTSSVFEVPVGRLAFGPNLRFIAVYGTVAVALLGAFNALLAASA